MMTMMMMTIIMMMVIMPVKFYMLPGARRGRKASQWLQPYIGLRGSTKFSRFRVGSQASESVSQRKVSIRFFLHATEEAAFSGPWMLASDEKDTFSCSNSPHTMLFFLRSPFMSYTLYTLFISGQKPHLKQSAASNCGNLESPGKQCTMRVNFYKQILWSIFRTFCLMVIY